MNPINIQLLLDLDAARTRFLQFPCCENAATYVNLTRAAYLSGCIDHKAVKAMSDAIRYWQLMPECRALSIAHRTMYQGGLLWLEDDNGAMLVLWVAWERGAPSQERAWCPIELDGLERGREMPRDDRGLTAP